MLEFEMSEEMLDMEEGCGSVEVMVAIALRSRSLRQGQSTYEDHEQGLRRWGWYQLIRREKLRL